MLLKRLVVLSFCLGLFSPVHAEKSYKELSHEYNLIFQDFLREKIEKLHKNATVEIALKDGTKVRGTFKGFQSYDDSVWIIPHGKHGIFADEAYDISELQDIRVLLVI